MSEILAPILGRILIGGFFLWHGIEHALNLPQTVEQLTAAGIPCAFAAATLMVAIEAVGGMLIIVHTYIAPTALILFVYELLILTLAFIVAAPSLDTFVTYIALLGGLLLLVNYEKQAAEHVRTKRRY